MSILTWVCKRIWFTCTNGAVDEIWTRDPLLTMEVLYPWATTANTATILTDETPMRQHAYCFKHFNHSKVFPSLRVRIPGMLTFPAQDILGRWHIFIEHTTPCKIILLSTYPVIAKQTYKQAVLFIWAKQKTHYLWAFHGASYLKHLECNTKQLIV